MVASSETYAPAALTPIYIVSKSRNTKSGGKKNKICVCFFLKAVNMNTVVM
jgi:hypothetical protein